MEAQWSQVDVFPIIADAIRLRARDSQEFVTHDEIVGALLQSLEAGRHIDAALDSADEERSREWVAHNMVAWFSQRITVGDSDWSSQFEREKIDGKWAYKPAA